MEPSGFQSPSLRGSGRFPRRAAARRKGALGFNPLHCGAVVASCRLPGGDGRRRGGFNPLHCGAVVASPPYNEPMASSALVSIPFIAGQWSLRDADAAAFALARGTFQSPSLRGSGRFRRPGRIQRQQRLVSIPFIAGQWSLRRGWPSLARSTACRFNPLHCGAVVASVTHVRLSRAAREVSIPFIAGQWSLPACQVMLPSRASSFQSPSLRGSGRFAIMQQGYSFTLDQLFQSPSLRGSGRFTPTCRRQRSPAAGFNPLHCGAVVASRGVRRKPKRGRRFQSPSLRGSGRFEKSRAAPAAPAARFNPLHCGAVVASVVHRHDR